MNLTDTHTHIYYERNNEKLDELISRCFSNGVNRLFLPNVNNESVSLINNLVMRYPENCFAMAGLHPCEVKEDYIDILANVFQSIEGRNIYAIGEIGIDLYWDKATLKFQQDAFQKQIQWAKEKKLPIVIHCREAFDEVFEILDTERDDQLRGIFHCFTGNLDQAKRAIDLNFYLGIGGVVTYKKAGLDAVLKELAIDHIVLETDSPYLAPVPFRGKPNESSYLVYIAEKVAEIHGVSIAEVAEITTLNSKKVFGI